MPPIHRGSRRRLKALPATPKTAVKEKRKRDFIQTTTNTFLQRKKQMEENFSNVHGELSREAQLVENSTPPGYNVFMEILKIKQVINLDDEEHSQSSHVSGEQPIAVMNEVGSEAHGVVRVKVDAENGIGKNGTVLSTTEQRVEPAKPILKKTPKRRRKSSGFAMPERKCQPMEGRKVQFVVKQEPNNNVKGNGEEQSNALEAVDVDMRESTTTNNASSNCNRNDDIPSCSSTSNQQIVRVELGKSRPVWAVEPAEFISRTRIAARAMPIDLTKHYQLLGLRYFQEIPGKEIYEPSNNCSSTNDCPYTKCPLSVVSFNILCQRSKEKTEFLYGHLRGQPMLGSWQTRKEKLLSEFNRLSADVFLLQEVQDIHYEHDILPYFINRGYKSLFTPRNGPDIPDGCAAFWLPNRLELLKSLPVYYNLRVPGMHKDNVGQVMAFGLVGTRSVLCISNTHIYYNMTYGDVKLAQIAYLFSSAHKLETQLRSGQLASLATNQMQNGSSAEHSFHFVGHILCGDFNMEPGSPLHKFIIERSVQLNNYRHNMARQSIKWSVDSVTFSPRSLSLPVQQMRISEKCTFVDERDVQILNLNRGPPLSHSFTFASVYEHWNREGESEVSTYHNKEAANPDFIFYTVTEQREILFERSADGRNDRMISESERLLLNSVDRVLAHESFIRLKRRLSMPTRGQLDRCCGRFPNAQYGSDHLALYAQFEILAVPNNIGS